MALAINLIAPTGGGGEGGTTISAAGAPGDSTLYMNNQTQWQSADPLAPTITYPSVDPADYDTVIDGQTFTSTQQLQVGATIGGQTITNNTLITGNVFENIAGNGLDVRNINGLTIVGNIFRNLTSRGVGVRMRSSGSTQNVFIWDNDFLNIAGNGVSSAKRYASSVDHTNLVFVGNRMQNIVTDGDDRDHCIYLQATAGIAMFNHVTGTNTPGNGVSWRCSGWVGHNSLTIDNADNFTAGVKYFPDHLAGPLPNGATNDTLHIFKNIIDGTSNARDGVSVGFTSSQGSFSNAEWYVNTIQISGNQISNVTGADYDFASNYNGQSYTEILLEGVKQNS